MANKERLLGAVVIGEVLEHLPRDTGSFNAPDGRLIEYDWFPVLVRSERGLITMKFRAINVKIEDLPQVGEVGIWPIELRTKNYMTTVNIDSDNGQQF